MVCIVRPIVMLPLLAAVVGAYASGSEECPLDGPINAIDYIADIRTDDGSLYQGMRTEAGYQYLNRSWYQSLSTESTIFPETEDYFNLLTTEDYVNLLNSVKNTDVNGINGPNDEIPLSFVIDPSLQGIAPFLSAYNLPVGDSFDDSRNLIFIDNCEVRFAPIEPEYLDAINYLHELWQAGLIDKGLEDYPSFNVDPNIVFSVTNPLSTDGQHYLLVSESLREYIRQWTVDDNQRTFLDPDLRAWASESQDRIRVPILNRDIAAYTGGEVDDIKKERYFDSLLIDNWNEDTGLENSILYAVNTLIAKNALRWIIIGGADEEWYQFRRDLETLGLPYLLENWQKNIDRIYNKR